jgi:hypothetical protein
MSFTIKQFKKVDICEKNWISNSWVGCESFSSFVKLNEMDEDLKEASRIWKCFEQNKVIELWNCGK